MQRNYLWLDYFWRHLRRVIVILAVITANHCCPNADLFSQLRQFWEVEEVPVCTHLTEKEQQCEEHFQRTHQRDDNGRYIVRLPLKNGPPIDIGESKSSALYLLRKTEQRLKSNLTLAEEYHSFLREYSRLGYMSASVAPVKEYSLKSFTSLTIR